MYTLGIPKRDYRRATQVLDYESQPSIPYHENLQDDGFYMFTFPEAGDEDDFRAIVIKLKGEGIRVIGADSQLTEREIMKLVDLVPINEGTCGYSIDGKPADKPAGPHLIRKAIRKEIKSLHEQRENRYVVTMDMYVYGKDDYMARVEAHKLVDELKKKYDNQAAVLDIVEQPFGTLGNRKLKDISKPMGRDEKEEDLPFEEEVNERISFSNPGKIDILIDSLANASDFEIKKAATEVFGINIQMFGDTDELFKEITDVILPNSTDEEIDQYFEKYFGAYADEVLAQYNEEPNDAPPDDKSLNERFKQLAGIKPLYS